MIEKAAAAHREGRWWVVEVKGVGVTQSRTRAGIDIAARDLVASVLDVPISEVSVWTTYTTEASEGDPSL